MLKFNVLHNNHLQSSINKYGLDKFMFEIIELCDDCILNEKEKYWIKYYKSYDNKYGYNKTFGGDGLVATEEIKIKISKSLLGIKHSDDRKLNQSLSHMGVKLSITTKQNQSKSQQLRFENDDEIIKHRLSMSKNSIIQLDINNNYIQEFISIREAERITKIQSSSISRVCTKERKSAGGFKWLYKNEYENNLTI